MIDPSKREAQIKKKIDSYIKKGKFSAAEKFLMETLCTSGSSTATIEAAVDIAFKAKYFDFSESLFSHSHSHRTPAIACELGNYYRVKKDKQTAITLFALAQEIDANFLEPKIGLIKLLLDSGLNELALEKSEELFLKYPENEDIACAHIEALTNSGRPEQAIESSEKILNNHHDYNELMALRGRAHLLQKEHENAAKWLKHALKINPWDSRSWNNLGLSYKDSAQPEKAFKALKKSLSITPPNLVAYSNFMYVMHSAGIQPEEPYEKLYSEINKAFSHSTVYSVKTSAQSPANNLDNQKIHIGFVSSDFKQHSVTKFLLPLIRHIDPEEFKLFFYSNLLENQHDHISNEIKELGHSWRDIFSHSDAAVEKIILEDCIDLLIDLNGHTVGNRLPVFCRKPAPVQASYLGYFGTTGLDCIDYWITDSVLHPESTDEFSSEDIYRLSRCWVAFDPPEIELDCKRDEPCSNSIVFACFSEYQKYSKDLIEVWGAILNTVEDSTLVLQAAGFEKENTQQRIIDLFEPFNIKRGRIQFCGKLSYEEYLKKYKAVDIILDTFPRTGGTTTAEALWMGVPVLTLEGTSYAQRISSSKLTACGLQEFIARSKQEYIDKAKGCADNIEELRQSRPGIRQRLLTSDLSDGEGLAKEMQLAFKQMLERTGPSKDVTNQRI